MASIEKQMMYKEIRKKLEGTTVFFTNYGKIAVHNLTRLRKAVRKNKAEGMVVKNAIAKRVFNDIGMEPASAKVEGQVLLIAAKTEPQKISKELVDFAKDQENFVIQGVFMDGAFHPKAYVSSLASLPSREQLIASVVGGIKAPITNFVLSMGGILRSFVVVLDQVRQQKESK